MPERIATYRVTEGHRDQLEKQVRKIEGFKSLENKVPDCPIPPCFWWREWKGMTFKKHFFDWDSCVGTGAACNSHSKKPAPSLLEMGYLSEIAGRRIFRAGRAP